MCRSKRFTTRLATSAHFCEKKPIARWRPCAEISALQNPPRERSVLADVRPCARSPLPLFLYEPPQRLVQAPAPLSLLPLKELRPFLEHPKKNGRRLSDPASASSAFGGLRTLLPPAAHTALNDLQDIWDEARQLARQEQLHRWLHSWLLLHIPLSLALILLGAVHA